MKFDAYAGSVPGTVSRDVAALLAADLSARAEPGKQRGRYTDVFDLADGHEPVAWVGIDRASEAVYFEGKGVRTPDLVQAVRERWGTRHRVTRADACEDFEAPAAFGDLLGLLDAHRHRRVRSHLIQPRDRDTGSSVTFGTRGGRSFVRLYEAGKMADRVHFGRPDWVRLELEYRPHRPAEKEGAARITPLEVWGVTEWTRTVAEKLADQAVPRIDFDVKPPSFDTTTLYLARTFRRHWHELLTDLGSFTCIGKEFEEIWRLDDEAAK